MTKKLVSAIMAVMMVLILNSCGKEYEKIESAEYYFMRKNYQEEYNSYPIDFNLNEKEHKIVIDSECESGTIVISVDSNIGGLPITVTSDSPLTKEIELPKDFGDYICFTAAIDAETEGSVIISLYSK